MSRSEPARNSVSRAWGRLLAAATVAAALAAAVWSLRSGPGAADGVVADGVSVFDDHVPAVANLDPALRAALRRAATAAARDGVDVVVNSGWRSPAYQQHLLHAAVARYGSRGKAARWVAAADRSPHVSGDAADIGPSRAAAWLARHGARFGLCRIYRNEPWHYELRRGAAERGCPSPFADPAHDPRMQL